MFLFLLASLFLGLKTASAQAPDMAIRLDQAIFATGLVQDAEKNALGGKIRDLSIEFKEDGLHAAGKYHIPILPDPKFTALVGLAWTAPNQFEIRVREIKVLFIDLRSMTKLVLDSVKGRLDASLNGAFTFQYIGEEKGDARAIRVIVNMQKLLPAFPNMALVDVKTKDKMLILKARRL